MVITQDILKEYLSYNPATGMFTWKKKPNDTNRVVVGSIAGGIAKDYWLITLFGIRYPAHRLAWFYMNGMWPKNEIDHKDNCKTNNRWRNLREATHIQNNTNKPISKKNKSGYKGVHWNEQNKKFIAQIKINSKSTHIGSFSNPVDAANAYDMAAIKHHGEYARINFPVGRVQ